MRCHFNLVDGIEVIRDEVGVEVSGPNEASDEAMKAISEYRQQGSSVDWDRWIISVTDPAGNILFTIPLGAGTH